MSVATKYRAETIAFGGVTFRRYPESPNRSDRVYFTVDRPCECCAGMFTANRYDKRRFCSRSCSTRHAAHQSCGCAS